ncbi:putative relaxin receptor 2-like, partial [Penaeus vannamei]
AGGERGPEARHFPHASPALASPHIAPPPLTMGVNSRNIAAYGRAGLVLLLGRFSSAAILKPVFEDGSCERGWFSCGDNGTHCIEQRFLCNQEEECPEGEDEEGCVNDKGDNQVMKKILSKAVFPWQDRHRCSLTKYPSACVCRKLTMLHCPGIDILEVPQDIDPAVTALLLQNNSISLSRNSFSRYPQLTLLHLESNNLTQLPDGAFHGLNHLRRL